jgi:drug/metabolite transporter (DMT)-like permease
VNFQRFSMSRHFQGVLILVLVTLLWGSTFLVAKDALGHLDPAWLLLIRFTIAGACLLPWMRWQSIYAVAGLELGFWLILCYGMQTIGLELTSASRSSFITSLEVVMLPLLLGWLGHRVSGSSWVAAVLGLCGVGLLSYDGSPPNLGDFWNLGAAVGYTVYMWRMEHYCRGLSSPALAGAHIWGAALFAACWVLWHPLGGEAIPNFQEMPKFSLLYLGMVTTALSTCLQAWGQRWVNGIEASIIYNLEPVWVTVFAAFLLNEHLGPQGLMGGALVLGGALLCQLYPQESQSNGRRKAVRGKRPRAVLVTEPQAQ